MNAYIIGPRLRRAATVAVLAVAALGACDSVDRQLEVTDPDIINPEDVNSAAAARALRLGTMARLNQATSGGESFWLLGGLMADEWRSSDTFVQRDQTDQRAVETNNANVSDAFRAAHRARLSAEIAARQLTQYEEPGWQIGEMYVVQAYIEVLLAEHMCSGIPFSTLDENNVEIYGAPTPTADVLARAVAHADSALTAAAGTTADQVRIQNAAKVIKGRALLNLGQFAAAGTAVAGVPTGFAIENEHSQTSRQNQIWSLNNSAGRWTVSTGEGGNGINFVVNDPRLPVCKGRSTTHAPTAAFTAAGVTACTTAIAPSSGPFDTATPVAFLAQRVYPGRESPAAWVTGIEARLIEAEAALQAGAPGTMITTLNTLRTTVTGLAPLTDPGTAAGRVDLLFRERAFWLFSTGHRLGDLRRLMRQYGRTEAQVFPTGAWFAGASYGSDKNFPIPQTEENNPEAGTGGICINRDA